MTQIAAVQSEGSSGSPVVPDEWAITPDMMLFAAAAVLTIAVTIFAVWLFRRAAREERRS